MIKVEIKDEENEIHIIGHTQPDICAAMSSVTTTIVNCLIALCDEDDYEYNYGSGECIIKIKNVTDITDNLFEVLLTEIKDLNEQYPDNVKIITK